MPNKRNYIAIKQEPYCCVPTCFLMVMKRHGLNLIPQIELGKALGLVRPPEEKPSAGYGTRIQDHEYEPNKAFRKLKIPLSFSYIPISSLENTSSFIKTIQKALSDNKDILICYNEEKINSGHLVLINDFDETNISILDPQTGTQKTHPIEYLHKRCTIHGDKHMGGLWVLSIL